MKFLNLFLINLVGILFLGCGALEPKFYPSNKTITSTLFPSNKEDKTDKEFENKINTLLSGKDIVLESTNRDLIKTKGKLLIVNSLTSIDTSLLETFKTQILKTSKNLIAVEFITVSSLPNLNTLRIMGARQQAQYVLILNSFSNAYRYHNAWTIPTILGAGLPYFFLDTQTIKVYAKIEYSLIDIKNSVILSNESVTTEAQSKSTLPESGIEQFKTKNLAISKGFSKLTNKFLTKLK